MDIEKEVVCGKCREKLHEISVVVLTNINLSWNDREGNYKPHGGNFDLNTVEKFTCPRCNIENKFEPDALPNNSKGHGKRVLTSYFRELIHIFK